MKKIAIGWLTAALSILGVQQAQAAGCVNIAGQQLDPGTIYDTRHACGTCNGQQSTPCCVLR